jgi:hypothetical protein
MTTEGIELIVGEEEGQAMKKHWLRGLLLGASMALLLAGGVALAAASVTVEPYCGVCCEGTFLDASNEVAPCEEYWTVVTSGWQPFEDLTLEFKPPGTLLFGQHIIQADAAGYYDAYLMLLCYGREAGSSAEDIIYSGDWDSEGSYGEWEVVVEGQSETATTTFWFARDISECEAQEFVPEPGTILLLGSGLAGLAGYVTLRWRTRE